MAKKFKDRFAEKWHNSKLRVFLQPYLNWLDNWASFSLYSIKRSFSRTVAYAARVVFYVSLFSAIRGIILTKWTAATWIPLVFSVVALVPEIIQRSRDIKNNLSEKYVVMMNDGGYYDSSIEAPGYDKTTVFTFCDGSVNRSTMFVHEGVNQWLRDDEAQKDVRLRKDETAKTRMKNKLSGDPFDQKYYYFLRFNYRISQFYAKQFTNEKKWGLCSELRPEMTDVLVQKTCYFDSYLTNTAPGKVLRSTRDGEIVSSLAKEDEEEVAPFTMHKGRKTLKELSDCTMANEPGVTTLMLLSNGVIPIWIQSNQAQSNPGQIVVAGSGSADWSDCEPHIGEADGLRKAVLDGMERELYEESFGKRSISKKTFSEHAKTMILGHFRWLEKGGKTEFVGVTCLDLDRIRENLSPEASEVFREGEELQVETVEELQKELYELAHPVYPNRMTDADLQKMKQYHLELERVANSQLGTVVFSKCNLSSTATILMLSELIDKAIQADPEVANEKAYRWLSRQIRKIN